MPYSYGGTLGTLNGGSHGSALFSPAGGFTVGSHHLLGSGRGWHDVGSGRKARDRAGAIPAFQATSLHGLPTFTPTMCICGPTLWRRSETAQSSWSSIRIGLARPQCADWYLPINPGTDAALALGMMHVIIGENLHDADYVSKYTLGFDQLREKVKEYPPERVAHWTGISAADIRQLAREYATTRPSVIRLNYGVQRSERGGMATRTVAMLPCLIGSWQEVGGGFQMSLSGAADLNTAALKRPDLMKTALGREARTLNMVELGRVLNTVNDPQSRRCLSTTRIQRRCARITMKWSAASCVPICSP